MSGTKFNNDLNVHNGKSSDDLGLKKNRKRSVLNFSLTIVLTILIIICIIAIIYITQTSHNKTFTEFYMLGKTGYAGDYPKEIKLGEKAAVLLGIINHENSKMTYWVEVSINGTVNQNLGPIILDVEQKWEKIVYFMPESIGKNQRVEFILYKENDNAQPLKLYLQINVK